MRNIIFKHQNILCVEDSQSVNSKETMKSWIYFGISLFCLISGLLLVIIFIHVYILPHLKNPKYMETSCTVFGFYTMEGNIINNLKDTIYFGDNNILSWEYECVNVNVTYMYEMDKYAFGKLHMSYFNSNGHDYLISFNATDQVSFFCTTFFCQ